MPKALPTSADESMVNRGINGQIRVSFLEERCVHPQSSTLKKPKNDGFQRDLLFLAASFRFPCWTLGGYHFDQTNDMLWLQQRNVFKCSGSPTYNWNSQCNFGEILEHRCILHGFGNRCRHTKSKEGHTVNVSLPMISVQYHYLHSVVLVGHYGSWLLCLLHSFDEDI